MALPLVHNTEAQFAALYWARVRLRYQQGEKFRFARLIWQLANWVQAGEITSNQVRLSFNAAYNRSLNTAQWNSFVTNTLLPIRDRYQAMLDQGDL